MPREQIAFMQDYKKSAAKQGLFNDVNAGRVRILLGSTQTMGTGVNAQQRLVALHHLDVPWLPSTSSSARGGSSARATRTRRSSSTPTRRLGSVDATSWQLLERKARFIAAALAGDRTIRRLEDVARQANQFAMAKALASGDPRLMQKAGIEAEVARLSACTPAISTTSTPSGARSPTARNSLPARRRRIDRDRAKTSGSEHPTRADAFVMTRRRPHAHRAQGRGRGADRHFARNLKPKKRRHDRRRSPRSAALRSRRGRATSTSLN